MKWASVAAAVLLALGCSREPEPPARWLLHSAGPESGIIAYGPRPLMYPDRTEYYDRQGVKRVTAFPCVYIERLPPLVTPPLAKQ